MIALFVLLAGCSNLDDPGWVGGGSRYASGVPYSAATDTGGSDTGETTAVEDGEITLLTGSAGYTVENEAGQVFVAVGVAYDLASGSDLEGGRLYYALIGNGSLQDENSRGIVLSGADPNTQALDQSGTLSFSVGPVDTSLEHSISVYAVDFNHSRSNEITLDVTGE